MPLRYFCTQNPTYSSHLAANFEDVISVPVEIVTRHILQTSGQRSVHSPSVSIIVATLKQKVKEANGGLQRRHLAVGRRNRTGYKI